MNMRLRLAAGLTAAAVLSAPLPALALETAPLAARAQEEQQERERLPVFTSKRDYRGVTASAKWLYQVRLGNKLLNLRLYTAEGKQLTFQEKLGPAEDGGICLMIRAGAQGGGQLMQLDQEAADTLIRLGITQIIVTDTDMYVQAGYLAEDLAAMRSLFALGERELLCVSGEDDPVTVVSEDGVRRQITE